MEPIGPFGKKGGQIEAAPGDPTLDLLGLECVVEVLQIRRPLECDVDQGTAQDLATGGIVKVLVETATDKREDIRVDVLHNRLPAGVLGRPEELRQRDVGVLDVSLRLGDLARSAGHPRLPEEDLRPAGGACLEAEVGGVEQLLGEPQVVSHDPVERALEAEIQEGDRGLGRNIELPRLLLLEAAPGSFRGRFRPADHRVVPDDLSGGEARRHGAVTDQPAGADGQRLIRGRVSTVGEDLRPQSTLGYRRLVLDAFSRGTLNREDLAALACHPQDVRELQLRP